MRKDIRREKHLQFGLEAESLEPRQLLAVSPYKNAVLPIHAPDSLVTASIQKIRPKIALDRSRVVGLPTNSIITTNITRNTTFFKGTTYVIWGEVHVKSGVTLTIQDGVTVLIRNGRIQGKNLTASALIFDSGSRMSATTVNFKAANDFNQEVSFANNGGIFFLGTYKNATKDGISTNPSYFGKSSFTATQVNVAYLGRNDPRYGDGNNKDRDDIDAISILGVGTTEWKVKSVNSEYSGDDGFDVTNSDINLEKLSVIYPVEDGLNISSSTVTINKQIMVDMSLNNAPDRELFDLEVDNGSSFIKLPIFTKVDLKGYWGNGLDEVNLQSFEMPRPPSGSNRIWYKFFGTLKAGPSTIYSINRD